MAATGNNSPPNPGLSSGIFHSERATNVSHNERSVYKRNGGTRDIRMRPNIGFLDRMRSEEERRETYEDWTHGQSPQCQSANALAKAGFFFTGIQDRTQCAFCCGVLRSWESTDNPLEEHKKHFPSCPFVLGREVNNVSLGPSTNVRMGNLLIGNTGAASRPVPENSSAQVSDENLSLEDCLQLLQSLGTEPSSPTPNAATGNNSPPNPGLSSGILHSERATNVSHNERSVYIQDDGTRDIRMRPNIGFLDRMRSEEERRETYEDWTYGQCQSANALAKAGFFFTGIQDRTQCAFCRGVFRSWESTDNPWEEHKKRFPSCPFVMGRQIDQKKKASETIMTAATVEADDLNSGERRHGKRKRVNEHIFCKVCMHRDCNVVFIPCRHLVCCTLCTDGLKRCPICHTRIKRMVSVFVFDE